MNKSDIIKSYIIHSVLCYCKPPWPRYNFTVPSNFNFNTVMYSSCTFSGTVMYTNPGTGLQEIFPTILSFNDALVPTTVMSSILFNNPFITISPVTFPGRNKYRSVESFESVVGP